MKPKNTLHKEFDPPEALENTIKCFWYNDSDFGDLETGFEVIPDGYVEIIFHFGNGCKILSHGELTDLPSPFLVGLLNHPVYFYTSGRLQILAIRCFPWTVFDLLRLKAGKEGIHIFEHSVAELHPYLAVRIEEKKINEAIGFLKDYFTGICSDAASDTLLYKAGTAIRKGGGSLPVTRIADSAHATVRTLERKFKQSSGHTVKDVSGLIRFEKVRNHLWTYPDCNLAELALEAGYTDQAHLSKEFKRYCGTTPGKFARKAKNDNISGHDFVAFLQSPE
ncbi:helix-turn-helix domain-containing protein [uncultured Chryseobacterium sp.]|uniref:AraC family transcriptional regulator n=1 Tax=uncultured Chryseobacterium sp. TaxID=259322 RepID=UPI0025F7E373|nr:helix-turn-helix domain-containing protein [uncultured Chryseobacterium sp.]